MHTAFLFIWREGESIFSVAEQRYWRSDTGWELTMIKYALRETENGYTSLLNPSVKASRPSRKIKTGLHSINPSGDMRLRSSARSYLNSHNQVIKDSSPHSTTAGHGAEQAPLVNQGLRDTSSTLKLCRSPRDRASHLITWAFWGRVRGGNTTAVLFRMLT